MTTTFLSVKKKDEPEVVMARAPLPQMEEKVEEVKPLVDDENVTYHPLRAAPIPIIIMDELPCTHHQV